MAAGDLITADHQWEFNGLLLGPGTDYEIREFSGVLDQPRIRSADVERATADGDAAGFDRYSSRIVELTIDVYGTSSSDLYSSSLDDLMDATVRRRSDLPLVFQLPGWGKRRVNCRPRGRTVPVSVATEHGLAERVRLMFYAQDPLIYNNTETTTATAGTVTNAGNETTWPTITVTAGATITNSTTSQSIVTTGSGTLVIDTKTRSVTKSGVNAIDQVTSAPLDFYLQPGANTITGTASVKHRDAWA